jgi:hypothetical protein
MSVLMFTRAILIATAKKLLKQCKSYISKKLNKKFIDKGVVFIDEQR